MVNHLTTAEHFVIQETIVVVFVGEIRAVSEVDFLVYNPNSDILWIASDGHIKKYGYNDR